MKSAPSRSFGGLAEPLPRIVHERIIRRTLADAEELLVLRTPVEFLHLTRALERAATRAVPSAVYARRRHELAARALNRI